MSFVLKASGSRLSLHRLPCCCGFSGPQRPPSQCSAVSPGGSRVVANGSRVLADGSRIWQTAAVLHLDSWWFGLQVLLWSVHCPMTAGMSALPALGLLPLRVAERSLSRLRGRPPRAVKAISLLNPQAHQLTLLTRLQVMQCFFYPSCVRHVPAEIELCFA